ncbi:hypothetical protein LCGC14_2800650 [marine sediment metagenome]|uniref:Uncharacterized protein n=1 Tax=marine sediment metagenome TaxID=412755 RepID=A0A0F8YMV9_9ZZZZ
MPEPTVNERIALKLGYKPPGQADVVAARKVARLTHSHYDRDWLSPGPGGKLCSSVPLYDTDPAAMVELVKSAEQMTIYHTDDMWQVFIANACASPLGHSLWRNTLEAAVAAAWLAAREEEAKGG